MRPLLYRQADFTRADLTRVVLAGAAGLDTANMASAVLREVDLGGVWLPSAQVPPFAPCKGWCKPGVNLSYTW